jgi:membrane-associated protein
VIALTLQPQLETLPAWGVYLVVWGFIFVESALLVGFLLPGDSLIFAAGLIAGTPGSSVNIIILLIGSFLAAFVGDQLGYVLGRKLGRPWVESRKRPMWSRGLTRAEEFYERLGALSVIVARFIPWARTFVPFAAGVAKMNYYSFLITNAIGALIWAVGITAMGYFAAANPVVRAISFSIAGFFIIMSLVYMAYIGVRALIRRQRNDSDGAPDPTPSSLDS